MEIKTVLCEACDAECEADVTQWNGIGWLCSECEETVGWCDGCGGLTHVNSLEVDEEGNVACWDCLVRRDSQAGHCAGKA